MLKFVSNKTMLKNGDCTAVINRNGRVITADGTAATLPDGQKMVYYIGTYNDEIIGYIQNF